MSDSHVPQGGGREWACGLPEHEPEPGSVWDAAGTWRPTAEQHRATFPLTGKCRNHSLERITRDKDSDWEPMVTFDVDLRPASPGPAWEWPVNDLGGQPEAPRFGADENDTDQEV